MQSQFPKSDSRSIRILKKTKHEPRKTGIYYQFDRLAVMAYGLDSHLSLCNVQFATALSAGAAMQGGHVGAAKDGPAHFNPKEQMVTNITLSEQAHAALQQIAALCPLHASALPAATVGSKSNSSAPCEIETICVSEEKGEGLAFACRHAEGGLCAGYIAVEARE